MGRCGTKTALYWRYPATTLITIINIIAQQSNNATNTTADATTSSRTASHIALVIAQLAQTEAGAKGSFCLNLIINSFTEGDNNNNNTTTNAVKTQHRPKTNIKKGTSQNCPRIKNKFFFWRAPSEPAANTTTAPFTAARHHQSAGTTRRQTTENGWACCEERKWSRGTDKKTE